jgi:hypothetical protein
MLCAARQARAVASESALKVASNTAREARDSLTELVQRPGELGEFLGRALEIL